MAKSIAVAIVHGVGAQNSGFAEPMIRELTDRFAKELRIGSEEAATRLAFEAVHWAPSLQDAETKLWRKVNAGRKLEQEALRRFMIDFAGDAIAYQPTPWSREIYDSVHVKVAEALRSLARNAGTDAPLCIISHSLGTIIACNYLYDLSKSHRKGMVSQPVRAVKKRTPLEDGDTLTLLYTMGSPLAIWSMRYVDFGEPIVVPSSELNTHYPGLKGEWINFFDPDDVIGYPLKPLSPAYRASVTEDRRIQSGNIFQSWNPLSHNGYWTDDDVTKPIAKALARVWRHVNP